MTQAAAAALVTPFVEAPRLIVREAARPPAAKGLSELLGESAAQAAVVIACEAAGCARITLTVVRKDDGRSFTRTLRFDPRDALPERGRAVGLLASTLLPEAWTRHIDQATAPARDRGGGERARCRAHPRWTAQAGVVYFLPTAVVRADFALLASLRWRFGGGWEAEGPPASNGAASRSSQVISWARRRG